MKFRADIPDTTLGTKQTNIEMKIVSGDSWCQFVMDKMRGLERSVASIGEAYEKNE